MPAGGHLRGPASLFGPLAVNCAAPDEGNVHLLAHVATDEQKEGFLRPWRPARCARPSR